MKYLPILAVLLLLAQLAHTEKDYIDFVNKIA